MTNSFTIIDGVAYYRLGVLIPKMRVSDQTRYKAALTGEVRPAKKDEWYLERADNLAYRATADMDEPLPICRLVEGKLILRWEPKEDAVG